MKALKILAWLIAGAALTTAFYIPAWLVVALTILSDAHPDYWPGYAHWIIPILSALFSAVVLFAIRQGFKLPPEQP